VNYSRLTQQFLYKVWFYCIIYLLKATCFGNCHLQAYIKTHKILPTILCKLLLHWFVTSYRDRFGLQYVCARPVYKFIKLIIKTLFSYYSPIKYYLYFNLKTCLDLTLIKLIFNTLISYYSPIKYYLYFNLKTCLDLTLIKLIIKTLISYYSHIKYYLYFKLKTCLDLTLILWIYILVWHKHIVNQRDPDAR
jgi:hypothetical protein